ncbi:MAG TPA: substrate-binding domain-containing protein [Bryobacteraceae bacterium]|nr:substrate-binding domain-containing protein [Bryobacteraceae bacterium]
MVFSDRKLVVALTGFALVFATIADARELRVCADPNNLPFSNERGEGFENKIAELIADELGVTLSYTWWAQRRGFIRNTLNTGSCDLVTGTTNGIEMLRTTLPYYRSGYTFVTRQDGPKVSSLDDPILHNLRIGIQLVGEDGANPPPSEALARRGIVDNVRGYLVYGDYREQNPAAAIMDAVAKGEIDVAIVWGPVAGYFAGRESVPLKVALVTPQNDGPRVPMVFDINMGVRRDDPTLRDEINAALIKLRPKIDAVLANYGVPRADLAVEMHHAPVTGQLSPAP